MNLLRHEAARRDLEFRRAEEEARAKASEAQADTPAEPDLSAAPAASGEATEETAPSDSPA